MQFVKGIALAAFAGALLLASPTLRADEKMDHRHHHGDAGHWDKFDMLKKKLDLSDSQVKRLKAADKDDSRQAKTLRDKAEADKAALKVLVDEKASDGKLKAGLDALEADHKALMESGRKKMELMRSVLTPLQQAKAVLMMGGRRGHWGGKDGAWEGHDKEMMHSGAHCGMGQSDVPDDKIAQSDVPDNMMKHKDRSDVPDNN